MAFVILNYHLFSQAVIKIFPHFIDAKEEPKAKKASIQR